MAGGLTWARARRAREAIPHHRCARTRRSCRASPRGSDLVEARSNLFATRAGLAGFENAGAILDHPSKSSFDSDASSRWKRNGATDCEVARGTHSP